MDDIRSTLRRLGTHLAYLLAGAIGTAVVTVALLNVLQPVQRVVYGALYLRAGPSEATITAILAHFLLAGFAGIALVTLAGEYAARHRQDREATKPPLSAIGVLLAAFLGALLVGFLVLAVAGVPGHIVAFAALVGAILGVPILVHYRFDTGARGITTFAGGVPVLVLLLLLAGIGIGWGWGYTVTAQEIPASSVSDADVVSFESAPEVREDLFTSDCERDANDSRVCHLALRGYEHEVAAARFLASHGVRCPYQNAPERTDALVTEHDGEYYRVTCSPHGD